MRVLPGLTSTDKGAIAGFLHELHGGSCREIAFFPTCLSRAEREEVYAELGRVPGLRIPHVHLRDDMGREEIELLAGRFGTEVFNVHPRASSHPYGGDPGPWRERIFVENADAVPVAEELPGWGGLCVDYAHWASGLATGDPAYAGGGFEALCRSSRIGCCHISSFRPGVRSSWGGFDHHRFKRKEELLYVLNFAEFLPEGWASLELENGLEEQLEAAEMLEDALAARKQDRAWGTFLHGLDSFTEDMMEEGRAQTPVQGDLPAYEAIEDGLERLSAQGKLVRAERNLAPADSSGVQAPAVDWISIYKENKSD